MSRLSNNQGIIKSGFLLEVEFSNKEGEPDESRRKYHRIDWPDSDSEIK